MTRSTDERFTLLNEADNIFVCCRHTPAGETVLLDGDSLTLSNEVELGHKIARQDIKAGEKVYKYGVSIGSAITDIHRAFHVHTHNLQSDYIPAHSRASTDLSEKLS